MMEYLTLGILQLTLLLSIVLLLIKPVGWYIAEIYHGRAFYLYKLFYPIEKFIYKIAKINTDIDKNNMSWQQYTWAMLVFNFVGLILCFVLLKLQAYLPLNPQNLGNINTNLAFNIAASFVTNTNWQAYSSEITTSYLVNMLVCTVQNFVSAATGIAILFAFIRGLSNKTAALSLGNFWQDVVRIILYLLLPMAILLALFLSSQGVIQNFKPYKKIAQSLSKTEQILPMGPVASQVAIKQLGTNGGGVFNANAAHPFENPNAITNFVQNLIMLLIPAALCYSYGIIVKDKKHGIALLITMLIVFIPCVIMVVNCENSPIPNWEGKELRFGIIGSSLWATTTTATGNGSVNSVLDSFSPLANLIFLLLMSSGEVIFGGVGSGLYGMLNMVIFTVFVAGLMIGKTPRLLGKKIDVFEIKMASLVILIMPFAVLIATSATMIFTDIAKAVNDTGPRGFTQILHAFISMCVNNGSSFVGLNSNQDWYNIIGALVMLVGRYGPAVAMLAMAGSLANKKILFNNKDDIITNNGMFILLLLSMIIILSVLSFLPAIALGPIAEHVTGNKP